MRSVAFAMLLAACTSSPAEPRTWADAWNLYAHAWCDNTSRCAHPYFTKHYTSRDDCVQAKVYLLCLEGQTSCEDAYPSARIPALESCAIEIEQLYCGELLPPDTCFEALTP